jgi:hypothetical protein
MPLRSGLLITENYLIFRKIINDIFWKILFYRTNDFQMLLWEQYLSPNPNHCQEGHLKTSKNETECWCI